MDSKIKKAIEMRQDSNRKIIELLSEKIEEYPEIRFGQLLVALGIIEYDECDVFNGGAMVVKDQFSEESITTLQRVMKKK